MPALPAFSSLYSNNHSAANCKVIAIETDKGFYKKYLNPGEEPKATFTLTDEKFVAAYELCNKHGLWKKE